MKKLFWLCWIGYVSALVGRFNFNAAMAEIIRDGYMSMVQAGFVLTAFFVSYGAGQPISGMLGDKFSAKRMLVIGFGASAAANVLMGVFISFSPQLSIFMWVVNGFAQSMLWPAVVKILSSNLSHMQSIKAMVNISTSAAFGALFTYFLTAGIIAFWDWTVVFFIAAIGMVAGAILCGLGIKESQSREQTKAVEKKPEPFFRLFLLAGLPFAALAVVMQGMLRDGVITWAPTLIGDWFNLDSSWAVLITSSIPLIGLAGVYGASFLNRRFIRNEVFSAMALFGVAAAAFTLMVFGIRGFAFVLALIVAAGIMQGINTLLVSLVPVYFAREGRASFMAGLMNAFTYVGSGISGVGIGAITARFGWGLTIWLWMAIAFIGVLSCLLCARRWGRFIRS